MEKKRRSRYLLAVYLLVAGIAVILALIGINYLDGTWRSISLGLATELLGVVLIFFLVNRFFLLEDWNASERIEKLISVLRSAQRPSAAVFFEKPPSIEPHVQRASRIDMCGVTLTSTLSRQLSNLRESLRRGARIRVLVASTESDSLALQMSALRSETHDVGPHRRRLESTFDDIKYLHRHSLSLHESDATRGGSLAVRLLSYAPSFGILGFDADRSSGTLFVEIYPHHAGFGTSPLFSLTPQEDGEWFAYFAEQFEAMWQAATPWEPAQTVFQDQMDDFSPWRPYREGRISQSEEVAHSGSFSLKKDSKDGLGDPHGGFRSIGKTIRLGHVFSGWMYRPHKNTPGGGDRLAIEDENFNGYGFTVAHYSDVAWIERRDQGNPEVLTQRVSCDPPRDQWYQFEFYLRGSGEFELRLYDRSGREFCRVPSVRDGKYRSFDRVTVHGGFIYYVDDLKIEAL